MTPTATAVPTQPLAQTPYRCPVCGRVSPARADAPVRPGCYACGKVDTTQPLTAALSISTDAVDLARRAAWLAAKAKAQSTAVEVIALTEDSYVVLGGEDYIVSRNGIKYTCNCRAGSHNKPCYHVCRVALLPHEAHHRATVRAALAEAARQTQPACPGYLRQHAAPADEAIMFYCSACDEEAVAA